MDNQLQDVKDGYDTLRELVAHEVIGSDQNQMALAKLLKDGQAQDEAIVQPLYPSPELVPSNDLILPRIEGE